MEATAANIISLRDQLRNDVWADAHRSWREARQYFDREHPIKVAAPGVKPIKLNQARSKIISMAANIVTDDPVVTWYPERRNKRAAFKADEGELWDMGCLRELAVAKGLPPPFKQMLIHIATYGYVNAVWKWNERLWPEKPEKGRGRAYDEALASYTRKHKNAFPFEVVVPHPARILMTPFEREPSFAIEVSTMYQWQVKEDYPSSADNLNGKEFALVDVTIFHSLDDFVVLVEGEEVYHRAADLGFVPYAQAFNNLGIEKEPIFGSKSASSAGVNPADWAVGILDHQKDTIRMVDELSTADYYQAMETAYRERVFAGPDAVSAAEQMETAEVGAAIVLRNTAPADAEKAVQYVKPAPPNPETWRLIELGRQDIDQGTFAGAAQGQQYSPGVNTATQYSMMLGQSTRSFDVALQQVNYMAAKGLEFFHRMIEAKGETVWVDNIPLTGAKLNGHYRPIVDFNRDDEATLARKKASAREELKLGAATPIQHDERAGYTNPTQLDDERWLYRNLNNPEVDAFVRQAAMAKLAREYGMPPPMIGPGMPAPEKPPTGGPGSNPPHPFVPVQPASGGNMLEGETMIPGAGMVRAGA